MPESRAPGRLRARGAAIRAKPEDALSGAAKDARPVAIGNRVLEPALDAIVPTEIDIVMNAHRVAGQA